MQVLSVSKYLLLQTASPAALYRLEATHLAQRSKEIQHIYFKQQHHSSLMDFLCYQLKQTHKQELLMQVSLMPTIVK